MMAAEDNIVSEYGLMCKVKRGSMVEYGKLLKNEADQNPAQEKQGKKCNCVKAFQWRLLTMRAVGQSLSSVWKKF